MDNIKKLQVKKRCFFSLIIIIFICALTSANLFFFLLPQNLEVRLGIVAGTLLAFTISELYLSKYLQSIMVKYRQLRLLQSKVGPFDVPIKLNSEAFFKHLSTKQFDHYHDKIDIYYKVINNRFNGFSNSATVMSMVYLNDPYSKVFNNANTIDIMSKYETSLSKKIKYNKHFVVLIKEVPLFNKETIGQIEEVIFQRARYKHYVILNLGLLSQTNQIYFLHSKNYFPNYNYQLLIKTLYSLIYPQ